jgi:hypothetical protein
MGYPYSVRREHYRRDPWYVMVKKGKGSLYTKGTIELTSSKGERFEVGIAVTTATRLATFLVDGKLLVSTAVQLEIFWMSFQRSYQGCHHMGKLS